MDIEELEVSIDYIEKEIKYLNQLEILDIAKKELEIKYIERQEQIAILSKSLKSSSRLVRWLSSGKAVIKQLVEFKN
tara:strand:- start:1025 stop:1255 length:231 start_codon:yes stop_codon:yes gene_type:complete